MSSFSINNTGYVGLGIYTTSSYTGLNDLWSFTDTTIKEGVNEIVQIKSIHIFPNPFSKQTTLRTDNLFKDATLTVYNLQGQTVKQIKNISGHTVTLFRDNLPSGLYFLRLTEDNKTFSADKLVITDN